MKQAAYQGIPTNENDTSKSMNFDDNYDEVGNDIPDLQYESEELQQMIDEALHEMNNGNYEKAITVLDKAKNMYPNSRAEELQNLIVKLKLNTPKQQQRPMSEDKSESIRQRKQCSPDSSGQADYRSHKDYTNEQLDLVKKINICTNYYQVLSVSRESSESEIKKSYKKLALQLHPDKNHAPGAAEAFKTLGNAMSILTDSRKRKEYDLAGANYITSNLNTNCHGTTSYQRNHQTYHQQYYSYHTEGPFNGSEEFTAEELFHMFFGNYQSSQGNNNTNYRRRPYQPANQRQPQEHGQQQPSLAFGLLLVMILMSMFMSLFSTDPVYSLSHSR